MTVEAPPQIEQAGSAIVGVNISAFGAALKELVTNPGKAALDGNGQLILRDAAVAAQIAGDFGVPDAPLVAGLDLVAALEPVIANLAVSLVALAKANGISIPPPVMTDLEATLDERFQQGKDR